MSYEEELARISANNAAVNQTFSSMFTPEFFAGHRQKYMDYVKPDLDRQFNESSRSLAGRLAQMGTTNSTPGRMQFDKLLRERENAYNAAQGSASAYEQQLKDQADQARLKLLAGYGEGDIGQAAQQTADQLASQALSSRYSPIATMISSIVPAAGTIYGGMTGSSPFYSPTGSKASTTVVK